MLLTINDNLLINPDFISVVEIKNVRGNENIIVWVDGRSYNVDIEFLKKLKLLDRSNKKQFFAG